MQACWLTQGALYNHFPSKNHLLATLIRTTQDGLEAECAAAVAGAAGDIRAELRAFVEAFTVRHCKRRTEAQHGKGKLTARERLEVLLDAGSFE